MRFGEKLLRMISGRVDLPLEYSVGLPKVELDGLSLVRVEQHRGLAAYGPELVVVRGAGADIRIRGSRLTLEMMTVRMLKLRGEVFSVELVYGG